MAPVRQAARPAHPAAPQARLITRLPESGLPAALTGHDLQARWCVPTARDLFTCLPEAVARLRTEHPAGLLVGLLPYPPAANAGAAGTPAVALLFGSFREDADPHGAAEENTADTLPFRLRGRFTADWPAPGYEDAVRRIQRYLDEGDAYQVNLAQRFTARFEGDPYAAWACLNGRFRPSHGAWIDLGDRQILCISPESFLAVAGRRVVTHPIKGTRPRHADPAVDAALAADLANHPKDRAENLMIVDLLRNDLGQVCTPGSVQVPSLFRVESLRNVHHLVSTVEGMLAPGIDIPELLSACFPGGSITGAPKRRAMEIIDELEPCPRDAYCGSIFWMTADGRFGSNIAIRTFVAHAGVLHGWAGAGIVADSDPAGEQQECLDKLAPLMRTMEEIFL